MYTLEDYNADKRLEEELILDYQSGRVNLIRPSSQRLQKSSQAEELAEVLEKNQE